MSKQAKNTAAEAKPEVSKQAMMDACNAIAHEAQAQFAKGIQVSNEEAKVVLARKNVFETVSYCCGWAQSTEGDDEVVDVAKKVVELFTAWSEDRMHIADVVNWIEAELDASGLSRSCISRSFDRLVIDIKQGWNC